MNLKGCCMNMSTNAKSNENKATKKRTLGQAIKAVFTDIKKHPALYIMITPAVLFFLIFSYMPMAGIVMAFKNFKISDGIFGSAWCGFNNFKFFFNYK